MTADGSTPDDVRRELYGGPRATFVARRKDLAQAARSRGDRDQAKLIEQMRKPAAAAHLVNLLAQADDRSLHDLVELGASIRSSMAEGDDARLRTLLRDRPAAIAETAAKARQVARASGESVSGAVGDQIVQTLRAAMASDDAAAAVRSGTMADALDDPGFEGFSIETAARSPSSTGSRRAKAQRNSDDVAARTEDRTDERAAERAAAQARITAATRDLKRLEKTLAVTTKRRDGLELERQRIASQLAQVDDDLAAVSAEVEELDNRLADTAAEIEAARAAAPD